MANISFPDTTNVLRFPIERRLRPTLDLLRDIAPDARQVLNLADAFGFEPPAYDLRDQVDTTTAAFIALQVPPGGPARVTALRELEERVLRPAIDACREAQDAIFRAQIAADAVSTVESGGDPLWMDDRRQIAETAAEQMAVLVLQAHVHAEEAEGVARAVAFARCADTWFPRDQDAETDDLIAMGTAHAR
jgi:hypothetical protein